MQKQIRCLFGWCNTIVAQAPSTTAWSPFLSEEGMRDLAFSCTFAVWEAVGVCLRTTDGRPYDFCVYARRLCGGVWLFADDRWSPLRQTWCADRWQI